MSESDRLIVSREDLRALASGETSIGALYDHNPKWGRRAALSLLASTGALAYVAGTASGASHSGTVVAEAAVLDRIEGPIAAEGEVITDLVNVEVYETEGEVPEELGDDVVALHGADP